jgi:hypothetical protein
MAFESNNTEVARVPAARGEARGSLQGLGEAWGWALVQRDWSARQREPGRTAGPLAAIAARIDAALSRLWRLVRGGTRRAHDAAR